MFILVVGGESQSDRWTELWQGWLHACEIRPAGVLIESLKLKQTIKKKKAPDAEAGKWHKKPEAEERKRSFIELDWRMYASGLWTRPLPPWSWLQQEL